MESTHEETTSYQTLHQYSCEHEKRIQIVQKHFENKGYRAHSGLQFGCELVLYADDPNRVHSDFCVHVVHEGRFLLYDT